MVRGCHLLATQKTALHPRRPESPRPQHKGLLLMVHSPQDASAVSFFQTSLTNSIFYITSCIGGAGTWGGLHTDLLGCGLLMGYLEPRPQHPRPPECCLGCPNPAPPAGPSDPPYRGHLLAVQDVVEAGAAHICMTYVPKMSPWLVVRPLTWNSHRRSSTSFCSAPSSPSPDKLLAGRISFHLNAQHALCCLNPSFSYFWCI